MDESLKHVRELPRFRKDLKLVKKRGCDIQQMIAVVELLRRGEGLPEHYRDHILHGPWKGVRELHVESDWLLIYHTTSQKSSVSESLNRDATRSADQGAVWNSIEDMFTRMGTHSNS